MEKGLGFLVGGDLREGRAGGFTVEASENFLEDGEVRGAYGVFAALGPVGDVIFSRDFQRWSAGYGDGRNLRRLFFLRAEAQDRFGEQEFLGGAVVDEKHAVPGMLGGFCGCRLRLGLAEISEHEGIFEEGRGLLDFLAGELRLGSIFGGAALHVLQRGTPAGDARKSNSLLASPAGVPRQMT